MKNSSRAFLSLAFLGAAVAAWEARAAGPKSSGATVEADSLTGGSAGSVGLSNGSTVSDGSLGQVSSIISRELSSNTTGEAGYFSMTVSSPSAPAVSRVRTYSMDFTWANAATPNPSGTRYTVDLSTASDFSGTLYSATTTNFSLTVNGLRPGTLYYPRVRAAYSEGDDAPVANLAAVATWPLPAGCYAGLNVKQDGSMDYASIGAALGALSASLSTTTCVVVRDAATYAEQVAVNNFVNNGNRLIITADPAMTSTAAVVSGGATAAFVIQNASVTVANFTARPSAGVPYGVLASSAYVTISSMNVDSGGQITSAGVALSSWSVLSYSSVTTQAARAFYSDGSSSKIMFSTMTANTALGSFYLNGGSSNTVSRSFLSNAGGSAAFLDNNAGYNTISQTTMTSTAAGAYAGLYMGQTASNTVTQSYMSNPAGGYGAFLGAGARYNSIGQSVFSAQQAGSQALYVSGSSNSVSGSFLLNPAGTAAEFDAAAQYNAVNQSTVQSSAAGAAALLFLGGSWNSASADYIENLPGRGVWMSTGTAYDSVGYSTVAVYSGDIALYVTASSTNSLLSDFISNQSGQAVYLGVGAGYNSIGGVTAQSGASGAGLAALHLSGASWNAVTQSSVTNLSGDALLLDGGAGNDSVSNSTATSGSAGYALHLLGASTNTILQSFFYDSGLSAGYLDSVSSITIDQSTFSSTGSNGLYLTNCSTSSVARSYMRSAAAGGGLYLANNSNLNSISQSTMTAGAAGAYALYMTAASSNSVARSYLSNPSGTAAFLFTNANYNSISQSTMTSNSGNGYALYMAGASFNTVGQSYVYDSSGHGAVLAAGANSNAVTQTTMQSNAASYYALFMTGASSNTISQSYVLNPSGGGAYLAGGSNGNAVVQSTVAGYGGAGVYIGQSSLNVISGSYIQGSTAAYVCSSTGTEIDSSALVSTGAGSGLWLSTGNVTLSMSSNVVQGGRQGAGVYIDAGNSGTINLSTNVILAGALYGLYAANQAPGTMLWIASNTILPTVGGGGNTYGLYFNGLTSGATIQNNGVYYRASGSMGGQTSYALYAQSAAGLEIDHNRLSNPGMITAGSYAAVYLAGTTNTLFKFNDVHSTGTALTQAFLFQAQGGSTGTQLRDNVFFSSFAVSGAGSSSATLSIDGASQAGLVSAYNGFFSSNSLVTALCVGVGQPLSSPWTCNSALQDQFSISGNNPLWADPGAAVEDFHPKTQAANGRWFNGSMSMSDSATSPTIDAADPAEPYAAEPSPNGGRANQGSYGDTSQASSPPPPQGCVLEYPAGPGQPFTGIQAAVSAIPHGAALGGNACVVVRVAGTYNEQVVVSSINTGNFRVTISPGPGLSPGAVILNPPGGGLNAGFLIQNASVTLAGITVSPAGGALSYGIRASSPNVTLSSVSVIDNLSKITAAGIALSSWSVLSYSSVSVQVSTGLYMDGQGAAVLYSTAASNGGSASGLFLNGASNNAFIGLYAFNPAGTGAALSLANSNSISLSTIASNAAGAQALRIVNSAFNAVGQSYIANAAGAGGACYIGGSSTNTIAQSTISAGAGYGLYVTASASITVTQSLVAGGSGYGAELIGANNNLIFLSTVTGVGANYAALYMSGAARNTVSQSYISNPVSTAAFLDVNASSNTIVLSTMSGDSTFPALGLSGASYNNVLQSYAVNPAGDAVALNGSGNNNISSDTLSGNAAGYAALHLYNYSSNNGFAQDFISNPAGYGVWYYYADGNTIGQSTITSNGGGAAAYFNASGLGALSDTITQSYLYNSGTVVSISGGAQGATIQQSVVAGNSASPAVVLAGGANTVTRSFVSNPLGAAVIVSTGTSGGPSATLSLSTITAGGAGPAVSVFGGPTQQTSIASSYIQGSTAVYVSGAGPGVSVTASVLVSAAAGGSALQVAASNGFSALGNVIAGGPQGAGVYIDAGNSGTINLSTNSIAAGAQYGIYAASQAAGAVVWIASNTIVPTSTAAYNTYGLYFNGLVSGATVQNNSVVYRTPGAAAVTYFLLAANSAGLELDHNRFSNPGMVLSGTFGGAAMSHTPSSVIKFNDFHSTGTALAGGLLLQFNGGSTGSVIKSNVFSSSMAVTGSSATLAFDVSSRLNTQSDYNDFFSSNAANAGLWGTFGYPLGSVWTTFTSQDANSIAAHPLWADPSAGAENFHPMSQGGRCVDPPACSSFSNDPVTSPTIDAGDVSEPFANEPAPNGGRANQGSYGNTAQASKSVPVPGCDEEYSVGTGQANATIGAALAAIAPPLSDNVCVVLRSTGPYNEAVVVPAMAYSSPALRLTILPGPNLTQRPAVNPPGTAAFTVNQASVTLLGIDVLPGSAIAYGIKATQPYLRLSSVNVLDAAGNISGAGVLLSSYSSIANSTISVIGAHGVELDGRLNSVALSSMTNNSASKCALLAAGSSLNSVSRAYIANVSGHAACLDYGASFNTLSQSTMSASAATTYAGLYLGQASSNTVAQVYAASAGGPAAWLGVNARYNAISSSTFQGGAGDALDLNGSYNTLAQNFITGSGSNGADVTGTGNVVSQSTVATQSAADALLLNGAQGNVVTQSYIGNASGHGAYFVGSTSNTISFSTAASGAAGGYALYLGGSSSNTVLQSYVSNPSGNAAWLDTNSNANVVSYSTVASNGGGYAALTFYGASSNMIANSYLWNPNGRGAYLQAGANGNAIAQSTIASSSGGDIALYFNGGASNNAISGSFIANAGRGVKFDLNTSGNAISQSTVTSQSNAFGAVSFLQASSNAIVNSYIQQSGSGDAVDIKQSTGAAISGSVIVAPQAGAGAVYMYGGSVNLFMSSNSVLGGPGSAGIYLDQNNSGSINLSTNVILAGAQYGIYIATQSPGPQIWITSNTILPTITAANNTYGIYLNGLASGATIQNNGIYYRTQGSMGANASYALYAQSASGLELDHNRFSNPGMVTSGSYYGVYFAGVTNSLFKFNDVYSTAPALTNAWLLRLANLSTGDQLKDNIFSSSFPAAGVSSGTFSADQTSAAGLVSNYNDYYSANGLNTMSCNGANIQFSPGWSPCNGAQDAGSISGAALFADPGAGVENFHPRSQAGRFVPGGGFVQDAVTSPTIDKADPAEPFGAESNSPAGANGGRANQGSYGNTPEASKTPAYPGAPSVASLWSSSAAVSYGLVSADGYVVGASTAADFSGTLFSSSTLGAQATLVLAGLSPNTTYFFRSGASWSALTAYNPATVSTATLANVPAPSPSPFPAVGSAAVTAAWLPNGNPVGVTTYTVVLTTGAGYPNALANAAISTVPAGAGPAATLAAGLLPSTTYNLFVAAINAAGAATVFAPLGSTATLAATPASAASTFSAVSNNSITAAWSSNGNPLNVTTYTVVLSTGFLYPNAFTGNVSSAVLPLGANPSAVIGGLIPDTTYFLYVQAVNPAGFGTSFTALGSTSTLVNFPAASAGPFSGVSSASLSASWYANGNPIGSTAYSVVLSTENLSPRGDFGDSVLASTSPASSTPTATLAGLNPNTTYFAFAAAFNNVGALTPYVQLGSTSSLAAAPLAAASTFTAVYASSVSVVWLPNGNPVRVTTYTVVLSTEPGYNPLDPANAALSTAPAGPVPAATLSANVAPNTTYYLFVAAVNNNGLPTAFSALGSTATLAAPAGAAAPAFVAVGTASIGAAWSRGANPAGATAYTVALSTANIAPRGDSGDSVLAGTVPAGPAPTATLAGLNPNTTYYLFVQAVNVEGLAAPYIGLGSTSTLAAAPLTAASTFTAVYASSVAVAWLPNGNPVGVTTYTVVLSTEPGYNPLDPANASLSTAPAGTAATLSANVTPNTTYYLFAAAVNNNAVPTAYVPLGSTATLSVVPAAAAQAFPIVNAASMTASWSANGNPVGVTMYTVVLSTENLAPRGDAGDSLLASTVPAGFSPAATLAGLSANTTYYLFARSVNQEGLASPWASLGSTSTLAFAPATAVSTFPAVALGSVTVAWSHNGNPSGATAYKVVLSTESLSPRGNSGDSVLASTIPAGSSPTATVAGLNPNATYYLFVAALNNAGIPTVFVPLGSTVSAASPPAAAVPPFPIVAGNSMTAAWSASGNASGTLYQAFVSTAAAGAPTDSSGVAASTSPPGAPSAVLSPLTANTTYYLFVRAVSFSGVPTAYVPLGSTATLANQPSAAAAAFVAVATTSATVSWAPNGNPVSVTTYTVVLSTEQAYNGIDPANVALSTAPAGPAPTATLSGLVSNATYYLFAAALNVAGVPTPYAALGSTSTLAAVPSPAAVSFTSVSTAAIGVQWSADGNAAGRTSYGLVLSTENLSPRGDVGDAALASTAPPGNFPSATLTAAFAANTTYYLFARAIGNSGPPTAYAGLGSTITLASPPAAAAVPFSGVNAASMTVSWSANGNPAGATAYNVVLSTENLSPRGDAGDSVLASTIPAGPSPTATLGGLNPNTTYFLFVSVTSNGGTPGPYAQVGSMATLAATPAVPFPASAFTAVSTFAMTVNWSSGSAGAYNPPGTLYRVQFASAPGFATVLGSSQTYSLAATFYALSANNTFYAQVQAVSVEGLATLFSLMGSTITLMQAPVGVYFDEISSFSITASAYAPTPAFSNLDKGRSATNIFSDSINAYAGWHSGNAWTAKAAMPAARRNLAAAAAGGKIYAFGGNLGAGFPLASNYEYDPAADAWNSKAPLVSSRQYHGAAAFNGKVEAFGGNFGGALASVEEYDPLVDAWTPKSPMPTGRQKMGAALLAGRAFGVGGNDGTSDRALSEAFDPGANAWSSSPAALAAARVALAAASVGGRIYAVGGQVAGADVGTNEEYNPALDAWTAKAPMPTARHLLAAAAVGGKVYALGGENAAPADFSANEEYDPAADAWAARAPLLTPRHDMAAAALGGRIYVFGGGENGSELAVNEVFDPGVSQVFGGLLPNTQYTFAAKARNSAGSETGQSASFSTYTLAAVPSPGAPSFSAVYAASAAVQWGADGNPPGTQFMAQASTDPAFASGVFASGWAAVLSTPLAGLSANATYYFRVKARNFNNAETAYLSLGSTATLAALPAPAARAFPVVNAASMTVSWAANGNPLSVTTYTVVLSTEPGYNPLDPANAVLSTTPAGSPPTATLAANILPNTTYYLFARAFNVEGLGSGYAALGSTSTLAFIPATAASTFSAVASGSMSVSWSANGNLLNATTYTIVLSTGASYPNSISGNVSIATAPAGPAPSAFLAGLNSNTTYYLYAAAVNNAGIQTAFAALGATTTPVNAPAAAPASFRAVTGNDFTALWSANGNAPGTRYDAVISTEPNIPNIDTGTVTVSTFPQGAPSASFTGLTINTVYYLAVRAVGNGGTPTAYVALGSTLTFASSPAPSPTPFASVNLSSAQVSWLANGNPLNVTTYTVVLSTENLAPHGDGGDSILPSTTPLGANLSATLTGNIAPNTTYYLFVSALNNAGAPTNFVAAGSTSSLAAAPGAAALPFPAVGISSLSVAWSANGNPVSVTTYTVVLSTGASYPNSFSGNSMLQSTAPAGASPAATFAGGLAAGTTYFLFAAAVNNNGVPSAFAALGSTATLALPPAAAATPFAAVGAGAMTVSWSANGNPPGVTRYAVALSTENQAPRGDGGDSLLPSTVPAGAIPTASLGGLSGNTTYFLFVQAVNPGGLGSGFVPLGSTATLAAVPSSSTFTAVYISSLSVQWPLSGNPVGVTTYTVVLSTDSFYPNADARNVVVTTAPPGASPSAAFGGLLGGTTYNLFISAVNWNGMPSPYVLAGSTRTAFASGPSIVNSQAGDAAWRRTNNGLYNVQFNDFTGSNLTKFQVKASTVPGGSGPDLIGWTDVVTNINAPAYATPWTLPSAVFAALREGVTNYVSVLVYDGLGTPTTGQDLFYVKKDTTAPAIVNLTAGDNVVRSAPGTLYSVKAFDSASGLANFQYSASSIAGSADASLIPWTDIAAVANSTYYATAWPVNFPALFSSATNYISVRAWDVAGTTASLTDAFYILKDTNGPSLAITAPAAAFVSALGALTGTASDRFGLQGVEVNIQQGPPAGAYWGGASFSSLGPVWFTAAGTATWSLAPGIAWVHGTSYMVVVRSSDTFGNYSASYATATFTFDTSIPTIGITAPVPNSAIGSLPLIAGTAADPSPPNSGVATVEVRLRRNSDGLWWNFFTQAWSAAPTSIVPAGTASWSLVPSPLLQANLASGTSYFIAARASDNASPANAGDFFTQGATFTFQDSVPPAPVTNLAAVPGPAPGQIALSWTAAGDDGNSGEILLARYAIRYSTIAGAAASTSTAQVVFSTSLVLPGAAQSYVVGSLSSGATYYASLWTQDTAGNWSGISNGATAYAYPAPAQQILGHVMNVSSQGITAVQMDCWDAGGAHWDTEFTLADGSGTYVIKNLPGAGNYKVQAAWTANGITSSVWLDGIPMSQAGVDFVLQINYTLGTITGSLQSLAAPASVGVFHAGGVAVSKYSPKDSPGGFGSSRVELFSQGRQVAQVGVQPTGRWVIPNLLPGKYAVRAFNGLSYTELQPVDLAEGEIKTVGFVFDPLPEHAVFAFPNPARFSTTFRFQTALWPLEAQVDVFDLAGNLVKELAGAEMSSPGPGLYHADWDLTNSRGQGVASGVYMFMVKVRGGSDGQTAKVVKKLAVVK